MNKSPQKKLDPPKVVMKRKMAGQRPLTFSEQLINESGITLTLRFSSPGKNSTEETKPFVQWIEFLMAEGLVSNPKSGEMSLKDGVVVEIASGMSSAERGLFEAFSWVWDACKRPFWDVYWFYIEHDEVMDSPMEAWEFFVASGTQIVMTRMSFTHDPLEESASIWNFFSDPFELTSWSHIDRDEQAYSQWMYKKYFTDTEDGQVKAIALGLEGQKYGNPSQLLLLQVKWIKYLLILISGSIVYYCFFK